MNRFFSVILSSLSKYHVQDFLCRVFQMLKRVLAQFNSKINGPFFVIQGCIQALRLFLSSTATDGKSGRKLKLDNVWPYFSSCNAVPRMITEKTVMCSSRKYPYPNPPPGREMGIPRGEKVQEKAIFEGVGICFPRLVLITVKLSVHQQELVLIFGSKIQDFTRHNSKPIVCFPDSRLSNTVEQTKWSLVGGSRLQESRNMGPHPRRGPDTCTL